MEKTDEFQNRYLEHQERKKELLTAFKGVEKTDYSLLEKTVIKEVMMNRRSQRIFNKEPIDKKIMGWLYKAIELAPTSCNRQAVYVVETNPILAEHFLVGGKKWINNANKVLLLFADKAAYKSPNEKGYMPYLDAGFVGENIYLMAEVLNVGCCFVNPNIREENKSAFQERYGDDYFCGAIALGNTYTKPNELSKSPAKVLQK